MTKQIQLGATYRCLITGFEGVATGRFDYLTGCQRAQLQATELDEKGERRELFSDAPLLEFVEISAPMAKLLTERKASIAADPSAAG